MKRTIVLLVASVSMLAGCGGSKNSPPAMQPNTSVQFTALAKQVLAAPADTAAPVEVTNLNIVFGDDENPQAFDDILPPAI